MESFLTTTVIPMKIIKRHADLTITSAHISSLTGRGISCYAFSTHISPLTGRKVRYFIMVYPVRENILVENGLSYDLRPFRDVRCG